MPHIMMATTVQTHSADSLDDSSCRIAADAAFEAADETLRRLEHLAWESYPARREPMSIEAIDANEVGTGASERSRVLVIRDGCDDGTGPYAAAREVFESADMEVDVVDLHSTDAAADRTDDIELRWTRAHAVLMIGPATGDSLQHWLRQLMDESRRTAKASLTARAYGLVLHGDAHTDASDVPRQIDTLFATRCRLSRDLDDLGLIDASAQARFDRFVGIEPSSELERDSLFSDQPSRGEAVSVATHLANAVIEIRAGRLTEPGPLLSMATNPLN